MKLKLNVELQGKLPGTVIDVAADADGVIIDRYWRNRVADAKKDNCVTVLGDEVPKVAKRSHQKED